MRNLLLIAFLSIPTTGCMVGEVSSTSPAAPTELKAMPASGGVHLTWQDNSVDELHFMVMRMMHDQDSHGSAEMKALATVAANATEYHDTTIESGMTYMYMVEAMGDGGESDSNEVEFVSP